jgi:hypothetical protein
MIRGRSSSFPGLEFFGCSRLLFHWIVILAFSDESNRFPSSNSWKAVSGQISTCEKRKCNEIISTEIYQNTA